MVLGAALAVLAARGPAVRSLSSLLPPLAAVTCAWLACASGDGVAAGGVVRWSVVRVRRRMVALVALDTLAWS